MPTMKDVCNQGLGKIGASRVNNLAPPISALEVKCASEYPQWKSSEIKKRRWVFATKLATLTALVTTIPDAPDQRTYQFNKPGDLLRAIRAKNSTWVQRGEFFYDFGATINLEYIANVDDSLMTDPTFIDVLAARVAVECAELATQSPAKKRDAMVYHQNAIEEAGRLNAFTLDPHNTGGDDAGFTWDTERLYPGWGR